MNAGELKEALKNVPNDTLIVMSCDAEGNGYSPLADTDCIDYHYLADSTWSGEIINILLDPDAAADYPESVPAVILWPTN